MSVFFDFKQSVYGQANITTVACNPETRPAVVTGNIASLTSPNYPGPYDNRETCEWILRPDGSDLVRVVILFTLIQFLFCDLQKLQMFNIRSCLELTGDIVFSGEVF